MRHKKSGLVSKSLMIILLGIFNIQFSSLLYSQDMIEESWKERLFEKVSEMEKNPINAPLHNDIGSLYEKLGDVTISINRDRAISYFRTAKANYSVAITLDPSLAIGMNVSHNTEKVKVKLRQYGFSDSWEFKIQFSIPSEKDSIRMQERLQENPHDLDAIQTLASYYEAKKNFLKTIEYYKRALEIVPDRAHNYAGLGQAYSKLGQYEYAMIYFMLARELNPRDKSIQVGLARAYQKTGKLEIAKGILMELINSNPENTETYFLLGSVLFDNGEFDEAKKYLKSYIEKRPGGEYAEETQALLKRIAQMPKSEPSPPTTEKGIYHFSKWNFEMRADENWQAENIELLREALGRMAASAVLLLVHKNSLMIITVEITNIPDFLGIKAPEDILDLIRKNFPNEMGNEIEPLEEFKLNEYTGAKRVFAMGGFATILQYLFIKDQKIYVINGFDMSAKLARNPSEYQSAFARNRPDLEKVMNTFRFLDIEQVKKDRIKKLLWGENPSAISLIWGVFVRVPLSSEFGVFLELVPLFFSIIWIVLWYFIMRAIQQFAMTSGQPPGCLYIFSQAAQLFYLFCGIRAIL